MSWKKCRWLLTGLVATGFSGPVLALPVDFEIMLFANGLRDPATMAFAPEAVTGAALTVSGVPVLAPPPEGTPVGPGSAERASTRQSRQFDSGGREANEK